MSEVPLERATLATTAEGGGGDLRRAPWRHLPTVQLLNHRAARNLLSRTRGGPLGDFLPRFSAQESPRGP